jgi:hypothetical protein
MGKPQEENGTAGSIYGRRIILNTDKQNVYVIYIKHTIM